MISKPLAFGLVAAACVVAAGGGAYIATLQHARHDLAQAAGEPAARVSPPAVAAPESTQAPAATPDTALQAPAPSVVPPAQPAPEETPAASSRSAEPRTERAPSRSRAPSRPKHTEQAPSPETAAPLSMPGDPLNPPAPAPPPPPIAAPSDTAIREQPRQEPEKAWEEVTVPEDSVIGLQLETPLSSDTARVEDRVDARVTRDVRANGLVAIPAGTHAVGTVTLVERGGKIRDRARLGIRFNSLTLPDNTRVSISTDAVYREGEAPSASSSKKIGGGAIGGAIIGAILGGGKGAAIGGGLGAAGGTAAAMAGDRHPIVLPGGTPLTVRTQAPVTITVEK